MISARFQRDGEKIKLSMRGHANYAEGQADIVCAAVSGIFYSLIGYLAICTSDTSFDRIGHGYADVVCSTEGESAMKQTCIGLIQIQNTYPECVDVKEDVWQLGAIRA
ncbi:MAG: ribosomal-processing cysteine protease Prp [Ruminococcaceae bacterium]|nr:ribosomal-processing cysteine protease Prp [Oscillospiraceae bacterium]